MAEHERTIHSLHDGTSITGMRSGDTVLLEIVQQLPPVYPDTRPSLVRVPIVVTADEFAGLARYLTDDYPPTDTSPQEGS